MSKSELIRSVGQIHISVSDVDRAVSFYRDTLGMAFLFQVPGRPMAFFQCGEVRLYIGIPETEEFRTKSAHYYRVDSIDAAYEELTGKGVKFRDKPHMVHNNGKTELWIAFFNDPDGNYLSLMEERPVA
jgi:catechol 2,3-dioxygenase-like lactoylglutathione lyase family enzyme